MEIFKFDSRDDASVAAAEALVGSINRRLDLQARASMIITGGSSPGRCYEEMREAPIDWQRVDLVLSDERWVPADHDDSNERQARETLLVGHAASANLVGVYRDGERLEERVDTLDSELKQLPIPFAAALLGMGSDGHFASLFPDASNLEDGLDKQRTHFCLPVDTTASPHRRLSLSLSAIARSDFVLLLIFGDDKLRVINAAIDGESQYPVATLLRQKQAPVHVFWAP
ncbi:MAG: 6-phosphogluconolactonase [Pseudomonadota bacterium]